MVSERVHLGSWCPVPACVVQCCFSTFRRLSFLIGVSQKCLSMIRLYGCSRRLFTAVLRSGPVGLMIRQYADEEKMAFKKPTRLECMMQVNESRVSATCCCDCFATVLKRSHTWATFLAPTMYTHAYATIRADESLVCRLLPPLSVKPVDEQCCEE